MYQGMPELDLQILLGSLGQRDCNASGFSSKFPAGWMESLLISAYVSVRLKHILFAGDSPHLGWILDSV